MGDTNIGWTDKVWNPTVGCSRVSPGCENCYAETFANRLEGMGQARYKGLTVVGKHGARWTGEVRQVPEALAAPLSWRKGRRVFVNSMSDLFHEAVPFEYVAAVFGVMAACPQHTFQVLTKRPEQAVAFFEWITKESREVNAGRGMVPALLCLAHAQRRGVGAVDTAAVDQRGWPLPNVHLGVSAENQRCADDRISTLLDCPATVRWVSAEPLLEDLSLWAFLKGMRRDECLSKLGSVDPVPGLGWVVVGGESGAGHRPVDPAWVDSIVAQCTASGVPVFVKQDSGPKPGRQGRLSAETWAHKEFAASIAKLEASS